MNVSLKQLYFQALDTLHQDPTIELALNVKDYITNIVMGGQVDEWDDEYDALQRLKFSELEL